MICTRCGSSKHTAHRCPLNRRAMSAVVAMTLALGACSQTPTDADGITPAPARLMVPPKAISQVEPGDDLAKRHLDLRRDYSRETAKLRSLQGYVRALKPRT